MLAGEKNGKLLTGLRWKEGFAQHCQRVMKSAPEEIEDACEREWEIKQEVRRNILQTTDGAQLKNEMEIDAT